MRALQIAASGMSAQQTRVEVISNNLANMSTTGYNARRAEFADLHYQQAARPGSVTAADGTVIPAGVQLGLGVRPTAVSVNLQQGALTQTGGDLDLAGCVGFYGKPDVTGDAPAVRPTLMVIAGTDAATPVDAQLALAEQLRAGGAEVETAVYDGAPHSFFDRAYGDWAQACEDVWRRVLALTDRVAAS